MFFSCTSKLTKPLIHLSVPFRNRTFTYLLIRQSVFLSFHLSYHRSSGRPSTRPSVNQPVLLSSNHPISHPASYHSEEAGWEAAAALWVPQPDPLRCGAWPAHSLTISLPVFCTCRQSHTWLLWQSALIKQAFDQGYLCGEPITGFRHKAVQKRDICVY
jgi:hypothetical protein